VRDTGIGIAPDKQAVVFQPFSQADSGTTRRHGGTGLGLTISTQLVRLMGGRIWLESVPDEGTPVHFTARFGRSAKPPEEVEVHPDIDLAGRTVLVVDDNATNRRILERQLAALGLRPFVAGDAETALRLMEDFAGHYDVVVTDSQMPDTDGFEFARRVNQRWPEYSPRILMLSSVSSTGAAARCHSLGISRHILKPAKGAELREAIVELLAHNGAVSTRGADSIGAGAGRGNRTPGGMRGLKILVAEDNSVNQRVVQRVLERAGHSVALVGDGAQAVSAWRSEHYDLILMDVQMPVMDGFEATAAIRALEQGVRARTPILALTAHAMVGDRQKCLDHGMDGYLQKPIDTKAMLTTLADMFEPAMGADINH
jgi:CheY-like chemotaxis protein